jgi:hypothetical protein
MVGVLWVFCLGGGDGGVITWDGMGYCEELEHNCDVPGFEGARWLEKV